MGVQNIYDKLKVVIGNDYGVCGLMGNLRAESSLKANNLQNSFAIKLGMTDEQYTKAVDDGTYTNFVNDGAGYGLAQWTYWTRKNSLLNYAKARAKSIGDEDMQIDFLIEELEIGYRTVLNYLRKATSVRQASDVVLIKYERPANQSESVRIKRASYGEEIYRKLVKVPEENNEGKEEEIVDTNKYAMKYNESNKPLVCMQTTSECYIHTKPMAVKGILWHSTGANNPYISRYVQPSDDAKDREHMLKLLGKNKYNNDWNHTDRNAGMNFWVGKLADSTVAAVQTMPWDYRPWGCGSGKNGSCNDGWIQFEICEDDMNNRDYFIQVYREACQVTAYLCKMFNLDPKGYVKHGNVKVPVILCHADSHKLGLGNNHGDVYSWFNRYGVDMNNVRDDVSKLMGNTESKPEQNVQTQSFTPYKVSVTTSALNVRQGPGTDYKIMSVIRDKGVYTIVDEASGKGATKWGKLKSGAGWISLDYAKKI